MTDWETCPHCGLLFETKKMEVSTMQLVHIEGDFTPAQALRMMQALEHNSNAVTATPTENPTPAPVAPSAPVTCAQPIAQASAPTCAPAATAAKSTEDLHSDLRARCMELKKANRSEVYRDAFKQFGGDKLSDMKPEDYAALLEVLNNAG